MSIFFQGSTNADSGVATTTGILTWPASPVNQLALAILGVEGVASGSGPWIDPNAGHPYDSNATGWYRVLWRAPSATGNGLEVWASVHGAGTTQFAFLSGVGTLSYVIRGLLYGGTFVAAGHTDPSSNGMISGSTSAQVTGNNPAAPSVFAFQNELVVAVAADQLQAPGYGTPTPPGWSAPRFDSSRGGSFGNVEITGADTTVGVTGNTGTIPWAATAATGTTKGATATLALRPASQPPAATTPVLRFSYPLGP